MKLRRWREERAWSQGELARRVHVSGSWISKIELGLARPKPWVAKRIARALGKPYLQVWQEINRQFKTRSSEGSYDDGI